MGIIISVKLNSLTIIAHLCDKHVFHSRRHSSSLSNGTQKQKIMSLDQLKVHQNKRHQHQNMKSNSFLIRPVAIDV